MDISSGRLKSRGTIYPITSTGAIIVLCAKMPTGFMQRFQVYICFPGKVLIVGPFCTYYLEKY